MYVTIAKLLYSLPMVDKWIAQHPNTCFLAKMTASSHKHATANLTTRLSICTAYRSAIDGHPKIFVRVETEGPKSPHKFCCRTDAAFVVIKAIVAMLC